MVKTPEVLKKVDVSFRAQLGPEHMEKVMVAEEEGRLKPVLARLMAEIAALKEQHQNNINKIGEITNKAIEKVVENERVRVKWLCKQIGIDANNSDAFHISSSNSSGEQMKAGVARKILKIKISTACHDGSRDRENSLAISSERIKRIAYPFRAIKLQEKILEIEKAIADMESKAVDIKRQLSKIPELVSGRMANLIKSMMMQTPEGKAMFEMTLPMTTIKALPTP